MANENSTYSIAGRFQGADKIMAGFLGIKDASDRTTQRIIANNQKSANSWGHHTKAMGDFVGGMHKMDRFLSGYQMMSVGSVFRGQVESFKPFIDEALKLSQAQMKFRAINLPEIDNQRAFGAVAQTVKNIKGLKLTEVTETMTDLHTATGNLTHALEGLAVASKFRFAFQTIFGDKFSPEQVEQAIQRGFKYLEITGVMQQGQKAVEERFNAMVQMMAATGGRVTPDMMLLMAQRGGPATRSLSIAGMRSMAAPLQELGAARAGTALMSLYQQLVGGRGGGQPSQMEFLRLGLLQKGGVEFTKAGLPKRIKPGAFGAFALAMQDDPQKAADMLVQTMAKPAKGKAVEGAQELVEAMKTGATLPAERLRKVRQELAVLFGNRMAQGLMDIFVTQRPQVLKESTLAETAKNIQELYDQALDSPAGKIKQFENAVANLEATVGGPLLDAVTRAATALMPFIKLMGEHPQVTLFALAAFKLGTALGQIAIAARMSGMASLFGFGGGAAGKAAAGAAGAAGAGAAAGGGARAEFEALFGGGAAGGGAALVSKAAFASKAARFTIAGLVISFFTEMLQQGADVLEAEKGQMDVDKLRAARDAILDKMFKSLRETGGAPKGTQEKIQGLDELIGKAIAKKVMPERIDVLAHGSEKEKQKSARQFLFQQKLEPAQIPGLLSGLKERGDIPPPTMERLERVAQEIWPSLTAAITGVADSTTPAIEALKLLKLQILQVTPPPLFGNLFGSRGETGPGSQPSLGQKKGYFDFGKNFKFAAGGIATRPTYGLFAERGPEAVLPLDRLPAMMRAASSPGAVEVHIHQTISGDVNEATIQRIRRETKAAVRESSVEIRKVLDNRTRDRELMI
jgi:hypothetical protein